MSVPPVPNRCLDVIGLSVLPHQWVMSINKITSEITIPCYLMGAYMSAPPGTQWVPILCIYQSPLGTYWVPIVSLDGCLYAIPPWYSIGAYMPFLLGTQ